MALLSIKNMDTVFSTKYGGIRACNSINLDIDQGQTVGLIGETGCGKSVLGMSVLRLLPANATISGEVLYKDIDLLSLSDKKMQEIRGKEIGLLPQSPSTSLNPTMKIGKQIREGLQFHRGIKKDIANNKSIEMLDSLGMADSEKVVREYSHQLSGGMKQRALAAMSITGHPSLLIADEPTKGLDAINRAQIIELLSKLTKETGAALLLITHDLKVAASLCDEIVVMYSGQIVEKGATKSVLDRPFHPYTKGLLGSLPEMGLHPIPGCCPSLGEQLPGCRFYQRCQFRKDECNFMPVPLIKTDEAYVRCLHFD